MLITSILLWAAVSLAFAGLGLVGVYLIREGWQFGLVDGIAGTNRLLCGRAAVNRKVKPTAKKEQVIAGQRRMHIETLGGPPCGWLAMLWEDQKERGPIT